MLKKSNTRRLSWKESMFQLCGKEKKRKRRKKTKIDLSLLIRRLGPCLFPGLSKLSCVCLPLGKVVNGKHFPVKEKHFPVNGKHFPVKRKI